MVVCHRIQRAFLASCWFVAEMLRRVSSTVGAVTEAAPYPGQTLGLPATGKGSLASWHAQIGALVADWAACTIVAVALFGTRVLTGHDWHSWMTLTVFFSESAVLGAVAGGSFGKNLARIAVVRLDGRPIGWWRAAARAAMLCVVIPAVVIGRDRRAIMDVLLGTVVVNRR